MKIGTKIQPFPDQISHSGADAGGVHNSWQAGSDKKQQYNRGHLERLLPKYLAIAAQEARPA